MMEVQQGNVVTTGQLTIGVQNTIDSTLKSRRGTYGPFSDHAKIVMGIKRAMRAACNWDKLDDDMAQALDVIADKIGRIVNGDPTYVDSWHDIQGYAKLIENRLVTGKS